MASHRSGLEFEDLIVDAQDCRPDLCQVSLEGLNSLVKGVAQLRHRGSCREALSQVAVGAIPSIEIGMCVLHRESKIFGFGPVATT